MKIEERDDAIKRLIDAEFEFEYDSASKTVTIHSYPHCEEASYNLHGFHYFGNGMDYEYAFEENDTIEEFIADAHYMYEDLVCERMEQKIKSFAGDLIPTR
jgi:hypothetical protein